MCTFSHGVRDVMNREQAISGIVFQIMQQLTIEDSNLFVCVLWSIWIQNHVIDTQSLVFSRAQTMLQDLKSVH
jgi:hypothetical protein